MSRVYPDELARGFERPPFRFDDEAGREIAVRTYEKAVPEDDAEGTEEFGAIVEMYVAFDPADRAQGIPPARESQVREWLGTILDEGYDVLAWHGEECVGHATLVPDGEDAYELAIFVLDEYQRAGIGSQLMEGLLGHGQEQSAERVWLTVERWNDVAMALYRKFGFETSDTESFELEMALRLQ